MRTLSYKEMREKSLCTSCGRINPSPEKSLCPECRERKNRNKRENAKYRKKIGICIRCGKNKAEPYRTMCYECLGKEADQYELKPRTDKARESERLRKQKQAAERLNSGLCPKCGKRPSLNGGTCQYCRAYLKNYRNNHRKDITRSERSGYGLCYICGSPNLLEGKSVCPKCYEKRIKTIPAMLENSNREYFRRSNEFMFMKKIGTKNIS